MFALRILIDAVQVAMKLHSLKIDDGEEKKLCRVGIRRFGVDCTAMIQGRGYNPEVYIGGIYKLTVTRDGHEYDFQWYKYESGVNKQWNSSFPECLRSCACLHWLPMGTCDSKPLTLPCRYGKILAGICQGGRNHG